VAVSALTASPLAKGLFRRANAQSILYIERPSLAESEARGADFLRAARVSSVAELRQLSAEQLFAVYSSVGSGIQCMPVVDNWALTSDVFAAEKERVDSGFDLLTGSNADEGTTIASIVPAKAFVEAARKRYGDQAATFLCLYPADDDRQAAASQLAAFRDRLFWQHKHWVELRRSHGHPAYLYFFAHSPPVAADADYRRGDGYAFPSRLGAQHEAEYCYVFDSLAEVNRPWRPDDAKLAQTMSSYWVHFAATGDPNGPGLPPWPVYGAETASVLRIDGTIAPVPAVMDAAKAAFWADEYNQKPGGVPAVYDWNQIRW